MATGLILVPDFFCGGDNRHIDAAVRRARIISRVASGEELQGLPDSAPCREMHFRFRNPIRKGRRKAVAMDEAPEIAGVCLS